MAESCELESAEQLIFHLDNECRQTYSLPDITAPDFDNMLKLYQDLMTKGEYGEACVVACNCLDKYPTSVVANLKKAIACKLDENIYAYIGTIRQAALMAGHSFGSGFNWARAKFDSNTSEMDAPCEVYYHLACREITARNFEVAVHCFFKCLAIMPDENTKQIEKMVFIM